MKTRLDLKKNYCCLLAPFITGAVLIIAFIIGRVFPFGANTVAYFDMAQRFIPNFYHIWDALHENDVALWFNWYSGLGVNDTADASFSLFWIILSVIPRRLIGKAMSLYVVMFFSLSAFTACLFLRKAENTKPFFAVLLSVCYAFCGYNVMYYTNMWQDTVVLFPLLMLAWLDLLNNRRVLAYILLIFINFQCNYYVFALSLIYLFFASFLYLSLIKEKDGRMRAAQLLGVSTVTGILLSAFSLLPKLVQTLSSGRFTEETGFDFSSLVRQYVEIAGTQNCKYPEKITMLFLSALPIAVIIAGLAAKKSKKKENAFYLLNILLMLIPVVCEGTNLLLHLGDYKYFPMRYGYILSFALIWAAGHYSNHIKPGRINNTAKNAGAYVLNTALAGAVFAVVYVLIKYFNSAFEYEFSVAWAIPVFAAIYLVILMLSGKKLDYRIIISGLLAETIAVSMLFVPYWESTHNKNEQSPEYIQKSQTVSRKLDIESSKTQRIKTIGTTLNCNYGTVIGRATLADWTHLIPPDVNSSLSALGYSGDFTRIHDSGGTAFTDALLGVTNVLSVKDESPSLYDKIDSKSGYKYYSCKYTIPYGITVDRSILDIDYEGSDWITLNNKLYTSVSGDSSPIVTDAGLKLKEKQKEYEIYTFTSKKNNVAYFRLHGASSVVIYVNGEKLRIPSVDKEKNKKYPVKFNQGLICLGEFGENEQVEIKLRLKKGKYEDKADFRKGDFDETASKNQYFSVEAGLLDLDKLNSVCTKYQNEDNSVKTENYLLKAKTSANDNSKVLLLPLQYNGCWSASVNSDSAQVLPVMKLITAVELEQGENNVSMSFAPNGLKQGIIASAVGLLMLIVLLVCKNKDGKLLSASSRIVYLIYLASFYIGIVLIYAVPLALKIWNFIL